MHVAGCRADANRSAAANPSGELAHQVARPINEGGNLRSVVGERQHVRRLLTVAENKRADSPGGLPVRRNVSVAGGSSRDGGDDVMAGLEER